MSKFSFSCPDCGASIELTEALAGPVLASERQKATAEAGRRFAADRQAIENAAAAKARDESAAEIKTLMQAAEAKDAELLKARTAELAARTAIRQAEEAQQNVEVEVSRREAEQLHAAGGQARADAATRYSKQLAAVTSEISDKDAKLAEAQAREMEARRAKREAEDSKRETELLVDRRLDEERNKAREAALRERDDDYRLKISDKDRQLAELREKLGEAQRKADQGSQERAGDVLEVDLYEGLQRAFPMDLVERVRKGQRGGDVLHTVRSPIGAACGRILWETKRTKNWQDVWLPKLREDQREARADIAALATETLPPDLEAFGEREGVWVTSLATVVPMAAALRHALIETATARRASAFTDSKKDLIFAYLTGPQFRQRMSSVAETYIEMRADLDKEKRTTVKQWSTREQQLNRVLVGMSGVYGDLRGIVGTSLPPVEGLSLPNPQNDDNDSSGSGDPDDREVA